VTQTSDKFDPEGRVLRTSQTREESSATAETSGQVTVNNELPGNQTQGGGTPARDQSKKTEETNNYEISRTTKTEVIEAGRIKRVSAAVLVDGNYTKNDKGEMVYAPRPKEEIDRIAALVRSAIGFDAKRGDQVEVVNLRFAETAPVSVGEPAGWMSYLQFSKDDIMGAAEKGVMALLGLIVLITVVRPLVRRIVTPEGAEGLAAGVAGAAGTAGVAGAIGVQSAGGVNVVQGAGGMTISGGAGGSITNTGGANISIAGGDEAVTISNRTSAMIDVAKVQGQVHAQSVQKVGELTENNPHEAVSIIRNWLHEDAA
jgi:flagellar M-ring protein FliF